jgi:hypothetical protein
MVVTQGQDDRAKVDGNSAPRIALRAVQAILLAYAGYQLFRISRDGLDIQALAWSIPWILLIAIALLLVPVLVRLGWRRFGRPAPTWIIAAIISTMSWVVVTMLCWIVLGIVLILRD